jgi:hypothetical protein
MPEKCQARETFARTLPEVADAKVQDCPKEASVYAVLPTRVQGHIADGPAEKFYLCESCRRRYDLLLGLPQMKNLMSLDGRGVPPPKWQPITK